MAQTVQNVTLSLTLPITCHICLGKPGEATSRATEGARCDSWGHLCAFRRKMTAVWGVEGGRPHPGDSGVEGGLVRNESQQFTPLCIPIKA
ncbi:hypothetical protein J1605_005821 [Eschrichtius robustus]|uniref:Uncharacterized protein n=1 Tax=Eschrichtius robustus TaxID=9764 RepID=A0AB34H8K5_ESCRO|nr:hypothetical protein J1605_005821 [Eschrichtius robustus]